ncbi:MAG: WGR domain-containing protein [Tissierellia bacterium]|nr:WGR domain-containing protein [Tissierellia bacterium]
MESLNPLYLVKVEVDANNNKYYRMIPNGNVFDVQYGRIGVTGFQTAEYPISQWNKKFNEKIKKGYVDQTRLVAETVIKSKKKEYKDIENKYIQMIVIRLQAMAKQAIADNYTISSNKVTQIMIDEAQAILNSLLNAETVESFNKILIELFKIIPRKMGKVKDYLANSKNNFAKIIQNEQDLLDVMRGQVVQNSVDEEVIEDIYENPNQTILDVMGLRFEEITEDEKLLIKKNLGGISDKFYQAWKVINIKTQNKFDKYIKENNIHNCKLLWHGSRNENWWSIINTGLVLRPSAIISGKMFGYGIYFAPSAQKSLGYTSLHGSYWAGGNSNSAFMSLYDVAYGKPYNVYSFDSKYYNFNYEQLQRYSIGANCLHAHAGSMLRNDEIIVYKEDQLTIKYLVELK